MSDLVVDSAVREAVEQNVSADFYDALDEAVEDLLDDASRRADANNRATVLPRDL